MKLRISNEKMVKKTFRFSMTDVIGLNLVVSGRMKLRINSFSAENIFGHEPILCKSQVENGRDHGKKISSAIFMTYSIVQHFSV